jgi:hypothetical protein
MRVRSDKLLIVTLPRMKYRELDYTRLRPGSGEIAFSLAVFNPSLFFKEALLRHSHDYYHPSKSRRWRHKPNHEGGGKCPRMKRRTNPEGAQEVMKVENLE